MEYIKQFKEAQGYKIGENYIIHTPFANDYNLISKKLNETPKIYI